MIKSTAAIDLFPFASSRFGSHLAMPTKPSVILIRWPVVIICSYLLLYPSVELVPPWVLNFFILVYLASNVALYFVHEERFASSSFYSPLVVADTVVLTVSLVINGHVEADFYLTYFLLIIICCIFENPKILMLVSVLAPVVYTVLLFRTPGSFEPSVFLRLPFLFIVSLFYGYFTQLVRAEKALKEEAEQRNRGKKDALDIVSHEFRTPLNLISGYAQALKNKTLGDVAPEQEQALAKILRQSDILVYMVDSILDLARIEAGEFLVQREEIQLSEYFRELRINYELPLEKPVSVRWSLPAELPTIRSDKAKLTIVLQNLINNAIKFTDEGTVDVTARLAADKKHLEIEVTDTGIGIPKEALSIIFEKFRQADSSSTRVHGGVGLGLHIVKVFIELLGGSVTVKSEPNQGSTFTVLLPI
ncbi:MAG TPA: HAMP domain-containing sensor histidine kinase [Candidatus Udaeobacter sp.]|nr:HAMP domain-containing sensor histidine kinase [Candidatus Udaeobacter sp.]